MRKEWIFEDKFAQEKSLVKKLLLTRGINNEKDIYDFINPLEMNITSPDVFVDMPKVTERLESAINNNEVIVIYGDFDADGVTSTSILYKTLTHLGANVHYFIPNRESEGHGLDNKALIKLMTTIKPKVIISVDCGISDVEAVKFVNSFKVIDVIITDHHEAPDILPEAYAIINPKAQNSLSENLSAKQIEYLTYLAGCGVAFKVAQALLTRFEKTEFIYELLPYVAVGTIADIVPLLGENRYFVTKGLQLISQGKHYGLKVLLESAGYKVENGITADQIAFGVAPRINASGRLDTVESALKVLISDNPSEIQIAVTTLNELNKVRQKLCQEIFEQADEMVKKEGNKNPAIVLANSEWHIGIIGIVASKLVEKYYKPVFLMNFSEEKKEFRCSARSIEGVPLYDVLKENEDLFDGFGGHKLAAGLYFSEEKSSFEIVKKALNETVQNYISSDLKPFIKIDAKLEPLDISVNLVQELSKLEPFGAMNPNPIFEMDNLTIKQKRLMGSENNHLRLILGKDAFEMTAVWWGVGNLNVNPGDMIDIAFHPQINEYNGNISVQLILEDIHSDMLLDENIPQLKYKIYDNRTKTDILLNVNDYLKTTKLNVKIFAESKYILDTVKLYPEIYSRTFTREDIPVCDVVMFFDYPADKKTLDFILEQAQPKGLHFMNYEPKIFDEHEILKTFNGMIKYAANNNGGKIELVRCASFLAKSVEVVQKLLELYQKIGFINILDRSAGFYIVENVSIKSIEEVINNPLFVEIYSQMEECENFQRSLLEEDLEKIIF
ncbi:single-stranded-DNA-specific exonuclease RecJ [bacterium]|nr:single-stranded-DNA-specific exonuclease RecJ [bacterium]